MNLADAHPTATASPAQAFQHYPVQALMPVTQRPAAVFTQGRGSWLWDSEGRRCLDLVQGWAVNTLGHAPPVIAQALAAQSQRLLQPGPGLYNDRAVELAERLTRLSGLERCHFTGGGAEANEGAIKLARKFGGLHRGGAHQIVTFEHAFHGRTLATMSASGKPGFERLFEPKVPGFPKARLNDIASVAALIGPQTVAVMLEPIQGEAGVIEAEAGFLRDLRRLCDELGLLLIFDEVQTDIGRTGQLWRWRCACCAAGWACRPPVSRPAGRARPRGWWRGGPSAAPPRPAPANWCRPRRSSVPARPGAADG